MSLLPPNAPPVVRATDQVIAEYLAELAIPLRDLWDPWRCPAKLLPWLAWAGSVDIWDDAWPERTQRQAIADSIKIHSHKGTVGAVEDALATLGVKVQITEWWQTQPPGPRGTAQLKAVVADNLGDDGASILSPELFAQLSQVLEYSKRKSIHTTFSTAFQATGQTALVATALNPQHYHQPETELVHPSATVRNLPLSRYSGYWAGTTCYLGGS